MTKIASFAEVVALLNNFVKNRVPPVTRLAHAQHRDFWNHMTEEDFINGFVPNVTDANGDPIRVLIPGNGEGSPIVQALRGAKGSLFDPTSGGIYPRMPADGGPYMDASSIDGLSAWISTLAAPHGMLELAALRNVAAKIAAYTPDVGRRFWYELDRATLYNDTFMSTLMPQANAGGIQAQFHATRAAGTYPAAFIQHVAARIEPWRQIAALQRQVVQDFLGDDWTIVQSAMEDFGQGVLMDDHPERVQGGDAVHMMDTGGEDSPPIGYHRWHASIRAIQTFDHDPWWGRFDVLIALAWATQSLAKPRQGDHPNPRLDGAMLQTLRDRWLGLTADQIDHQYDLGNGVFGYHPDPLHP